jgi:hypothetical protein
VVIGVPDLGVREGVLLPPFIRAGAAIVQLRRCGTGEKVFKQRGGHALFAAWTSAGVKDCVGRASGFVRRGLRREPASL